MKFNSSEVKIMNLAKNIKDYLENNGIKQNVLAKKANISENALNLSLNQKRKLLADEYVNICTALGLPLDYFARYHTA